ncbi:MAG: dTDP-3-amino-3,6-dideoxy-alpha-D-galactopyranose transaminase [Firmicutes bacterium]|nr:dTDP-3-amino-3,6-dideoxy-alpha-D-galactopyranose transaminase [Bacillota bacterium]
MDQKIITFLDLKFINQQHRQTPIDAATWVIDTGWYAIDQEIKSFEKDFSSHCGTAYSVDMANGLDALVLTRQASKG